MKKKTILSVAALIIAAIVSVTIMSCKKDNEKNNDTESLVKSHELSDMDKKMIAFGEKLKTASQERSKETMPVAEALNTMTNYQNFSMCDASHFSSEMLIDTFKTTLNVVDGEVLLSDLSLFYETTRQEILSKFNALNGSQKAIYLIQTVVAETPRAVLDDYTGNMDLRVIVRMMDSFNSSFYQTITFDSTDYWQDFGCGGKCGDYAGQCVGRDCVTQLNSKMREMMGNLGCGDGYSVYFTDIYYVTIRATQLPNGQTYWPWRSFWDNPQCISPDEMNVYLRNIQEVYNNVEDTALKPIIDFHFGEQQYWKLPNENWESYAVFTMGDINCSTVLPDD